MILGIGNHGELDYELLACIGGEDRELLLTQDVLGDRSADDILAQFTEAEVADVQATILGIGIAGSSTLSS